MRQRLLYVLVILGLLVNSAAVSAQVKVVATFSILADLAAQVGGDLVSVGAIVPMGGDPHSWEPTPREARMIAGADVIFCNGLGLDTWVERLIDSAASAAVPIITLSDGLPALPYGDDHHHEQDHDHGSYDPHKWLDVTFTMEYVRRIADILGEIDPGNGAYYQSRAAAYIEKLAELDAWLLETAAEIPQANRRIITYHNTFSYFAKRYGFSVESYLVLNPDREPSVKDMVELTKLLSAHPRRAMFTEPQAGIGIRYAEAAVKEVGGRLFTLYTDTLTEDIPTYIEMMRWNGKSLLEALQ